MLIDICIKFHEYSLSGFQVIERTQFVTDRQTDGQTDRRTDRQTPGGKTICLPTLKGGDINKEKPPFCLTFKKISSPSGGRALKTPLVHSKCIYFCTNMLI